MVPVAALIGALDGYRTEKRLQRANRIGKAVGFILFWVVGLAITGATCYFIWSSWQSNDGSTNDLIIVTGFVAFISFFLEAMAFIILVIPVRPTPRNQEIASALRQLIARDDDKLTPIAKLQPKKLLPTELAGHAITLRPIRHTPNTVVTTLVAIIVIVLVAVPLAFLCGGLALISTTFTNSNDTIFNGAISPLWTPLVYVGIALLLIPLRIWTALGRRYGNATKVVLDEQGVQYRRGRQDHLIAWNQIRSLAQITVNPLGTMIATTNAATPVGAGSTTYLIDSGTDLFVWSVASQAKDDEFLAAETLLQHVATRTGLPLRDATDLATEITHYGAINAGRVLMQRTRTDTSDDRSLAILATLKPIAPAPKSRKLKIALITIVVALLAVANGILPLVGFRLDRAMSVYQANFVSSMHADTPIYATDFAENDGTWPEARASSEDFRNYVFKGGAYHLSGTKAGQYIDAWLSTWLTDGAVEITVSQTEQSPVVPHEDQTGGAGVIFHADSGNNHFIAFVINTDGHWWLSRYQYVDDHASDNWHYLNEGFSSAIHKGLGVQNTILYIQRGRHITVYVNGQQVDSEGFSADYYSDLPMDGYAGVYSDQSAMDTAFIRFAVYRLPTPPDFWTAVKNA